MKKNETYTVMFSTEFIDKEMPTNNFEHAFSCLIGLGGLNDEYMLRIRRDDKTLMSMGYATGLEVYINELNEDEKGFWQNTGLKRFVGMYGENYHEEIDFNKMNKEIEAKRYVVDYIIPQIKIFVPLMDEDSRKDAWKRDMIIVEWEFGTNLKNRWDLVEMIQEAYAEEISKLNN